MKALAAALKNNREETEALVNAAPGWTIAAKSFDTLFKSMADPEDRLWSAGFIGELHRTYLDARDKDKSCANITIRTVNAMPKSKADGTKKVMLQVADVCRIFNASHKVNFEPGELPGNFNLVPVKPSAKKGFFTFAEEMPSLYPKTSLTFDYWMPKMLDWTKEIREKNLKSWKGDAILEHESCTDFMRICLLFISDPQHHLPVAKAEDREALLKLAGKTFSWIKKSAKREDIAANSAELEAALKQLGKETGIAIPYEAWARLQHASFIKPLLKQP